MTTEGSIQSTGHSWFQIKSVDKKIRELESFLSQSLALTNSINCDFNPGRDLEVLTPAELPSKPGIASKEGQARLLHDLANIELQAMELAVRTLQEFPEADADFRNELTDLALSESRHLGLCLEGLRKLGFQWGDWPVHLSLWQAVSSENSLLDRIFIVHRHLEGSGLDAGESILRRLHGVPGNDVKNIVRTIVDEEVAHVAFGSKWYHAIAKEHKIDLEFDFKTRMHSAFKLAPRRDKIAIDLRKQAGFTDFEIEAIRFCQQQKIC